MFGRAARPRWRSGRGRKRYERSQAKLYARALSRSLSGGRAVAPFGVPPAAVRPKRGR